MPTTIYLNLPVRDLDRSKGFFTALGFRADPRFTDENAACMQISREIYLMLLVEPFFRTFTSKDVADATRSTEAIMALSVESRQRVDELVEAALGAGGSPSNRTNDRAFMYGRSFQDPDGHLWEVMYLDPTALPERP